VYTTSSAVTGSPSPDELVMIVYERHVVGAGLDVGGQAGSAPKFSSKFISMWYWCQK
jgi:hypothetical protein